MDARHDRLRTLGPASALALGMALGSPALADDSLELEGLINDFTPSTTVPGGPWEVRGIWRAEVDDDDGEFSAVLTMVRSDLWAITAGADPADPAARGPHTHHVTLRRGAATRDGSRIVITGEAQITVSGNVAGFSPAPVTVELSGGEAVRTSNVRVTFGGAAATHYGAQPLEGVVTKRDD